MELTINGESRRLKNGSSVKELLASIDIDSGAARGIAIAVNERIVRRDSWNKKILQAGDRVEVVTAQQGG